MLDDPVRALGFQRVKVRNDVLPHGITAVAQRVAMHAVVPEPQEVTRWHFADGCAVVFAKGDQVSVGHASP